MKKIKFSLFVAALVTLMLGCERESLSPESSSSPQVQGAGGNFTSMYNRNKVEILGNLDILAKSLAQRINDLGFAAVVREEVLLNDDYMVTLTKLKQRCTNVGLNLADQMANSLSACGGTADQMLKLPLIADGFTIEGRLFKPTLFVPYLDRPEFLETATWDGLMPEYIGTVLGKQGQQFRVYDAAGAVHSFTETQLRTHPTWFVSLAPMLGEFDQGFSPLRFWHLCKCRNVGTEIDPIMVCSTVGDGIRCGRTTLFGRSCPGGIICATN